ncbi:MAG: DUF1854 domain-containing protein [Pirellulaceae bacterium]|nr:DUF1854 domain-containing protein [Pirellulaceae bacterium]
MSRTTRSQLSRDQWGHLILTDQKGKQYDDVLVVPLFPISEPRKWISIVSADGKEIECVEDPSEFSPDTLEHLNKELMYRDFVPRITKVISVSGTTEPCEWHVQTNHGPTNFVLKAEEDIRRLSDHEVMIIDANGGRFRIDDTRQLDKRSLRFIEWYV